MRGKGQHVQGLQELFNEQLEDMFSAESQIVASLPKLIKMASSQDLKEALTKHLRETENQVTRLKKIFSALGISPKRRTCAAMEGLLREAEEITMDKSKSALLDAAIICAAQKVEHYEIASYGTLCSFAKCLDLNNNIIDLIQDTLDEEGAADKKLTRIAEGSIFTTGINQEAMEAVTSSPAPSNRKGRK